MRARWLQYPGSKWQKHQALVENEELAPVLPAATVYHQAAFEDYLLEFPLIYVKPILGAGGANVIRIENNEEGITIKKSGASRHFNQKEKAAAYLNKLTAKRKYLIQQGIDLLKLDNSSVDFRVLLLKRNGTWHWYGMIGKKGRPGAIVTNRARGGRPILFKDALIQAFQYNEEQIAGLEESIRHYSFMIAHTLNRHFPRVNQLGLDIGIDSEGKPFLLEANTRPQYQLFRHHENKRLYGRVASTISKLRSKKMKRAVRARR